MARSYARGPMEGRKTEALSSPFRQNRFVFLARCWPVWPSPDQRTKCLLHPRSRFREWVRLGKMIFGVVERRIPAQPPLEISELIERISCDRERQHEREGSIRKAQRTIAFIPLRGAVALGVDQQGDAADFLSYAQASIGGAQ